MYIHTEISRELLRGMAPDYPSTVSRQSSGKVKKRDTRIHDVTFLEIWNSNQKATIPSLNTRIEHRKTTNQKRVENVIIWDFVNSNAMNFVKRTLKQHEHKI